jgi:hypothetical protein
MKKIPIPKVIYTYEEPRTEQEAKQAEENVSKAYEILFEETEKRLKDKGINLNW